MTNATAAEKSLNIVTYRDFVDPRAKGEDWILKAVKQNYESGGAKNLLAGKNVSLIKRYAAGDHPMDKFRAMFPKAKQKKNDATKTDIEKRLALDMGIDYEPLGILHQPLSQAISALQKQQVDISFDAIDPTANANRKMDIDRLRNQPLFDQAIAPVRNVLKMPVTSPGPQNNTPTVDMATLGLNPMKEDELNLYVNVFYKMRPEAAFEITTDALMYWNDLKSKSDLEKRDQVYYGVSSNRTYMSDITHLPAYDYVFPGNVYAPESDLPDYTDVPFLYIEKNYNVEQLLNVVGKEEIPEEFVRNIYDRFWKARGYSHRWAKATQQQKNEGVAVVYMEFKSFDVLRVERYKNNQRTYLNVVPFDYKHSSAFKLVQNKWPQQTYYAYWVPGTDIILKSGKVLGSVREPGKESLSRFTIQIERSKLKSDVELSMTAVDDAQRAYIKLQQSVIMAKPKGMYFDMKYIREAAEQLEEDLDLSVGTLLNLFVAHNIMIGDSEEMDGTMAGQFLPFREIPGGLGSEVREYLTIIQNSKDFISQLTGYNDAMTGQTPNSDALVGMEKLRLQAAANALYPSQKAAKRQHEKTAHAWAPMIQFICRPENKGSAARKALEAIVGARKIDVISDMDSLSAHQFGLRVEDALTVQQTEELRQLVTELVQAQRVELSDYFLVTRRTINYKDAQQLLIIREKKKADDLRQQMQAANDATVQAAQIREQANTQRTGITAQGYVQEQALANEGNMQLFEKKAQLEILLKKMDEQIAENNKAAQERQAQQKLFTKHNLETQRSLS